MPVSDILARVASTKTITAEDALAARRAVYGGDVAIDPHEIEMLFEVDEAADEADPSWVALLSEATVDYLVHQVEPHGYIDAANADWLVKRIAKDGVVKTGTELEVLVKVLEAAKSSPEELVAFALQQVKTAVVSGEGPLAHNGAPLRGHVDRGETELLRRILYAFGGDGGIAITRREAEVLFDINDATVEADNDPAWTDLFVKAIANFMMAASGYQVPSREVALRRERWLDGSTDGIAGLFARLAEGGFHGVMEAYNAPSAEDQLEIRNAGRAAQIASSEVVDEDEATWLAHRIGRDGQMHENEKALLRFIRQESPQIHPSLKPLIDKAA